MDQSHINPNAMMDRMQRVYETQLVQAAQNLSNACTPGFKAFHVLVKEHSYNVGKHVVSYVGIESIRRSPVDGAVSFTRDPYHLALSGSGHFALQTLDDKVRYARSGQFHLNDEGYVVDVNGNMLLSSDLTPIQLPGLSKWNVSSKGFITVNGKPLGAVGVFTFDDPDAIQARGHNLFETDQKAEPSELFHITQGALEESNVSIMDEALNLILIQRNFEYSQKVLDEYDQQRRKVNHVSARNV